MNADNEQRFEWQNVRFVPILHNRVEFAREVRKQFEAFAPDHVAVEYPATLKEKILTAVDRLPLLSVVHYREDDGTFIYLLIEPTDGQIEAIRLALANQISLHFIDRDTEGYPLDHSAMPDPLLATVCQVCSLHRCTIGVSSRSVWSTFFPLQPRI